MEVIYCDNGNYPIRCLQIALNLKIKIIPLDLMEVTSTFWLWLYVIIAMCLL